MLGFKLNNAWKGAPDLYLLMELIFIKINFNDMPN